VTVTGSGGRRRKESRQETIPGRKKLPGDDNYKPRGLCSYRGLWLAGDFGSPAKGGGRLGNGWRLAERERTSVGREGASVGPRAGQGEFREIAVGGDSNTTNFN